MISLQNINSDIKKRVADYLSPEDAINLSKTCQEIHKDLDLKIMTDVYSYFKHLKKEHHFVPTYHEGGEEKIWFRFFPLLLTNPIHTMKFTCQAKDQGWGNRKGILYVRQDKNENNYKGDIVAHSHTLEHHDTDVSLQFRPNPGQKYTLCYVVGGGGGHEMYIKNPVVQILYYQSNHMVDVANMLRKKDIAALRDSTFGVRMLTGVVDRLIQDNNKKIEISGKEMNSEDVDVEMKEEVEDTLASSLSSIGIDPQNNELLRATKQFLELWLAFKDPMSRRKAAMEEKKKKKKRIN